jgi:hypothetical protein
MSSVPEKQASQSMSLHEGEASPRDRDWLIAVVFVAVALLLGILFAVYALAWDGGGHT